MIRPATPGDLDGAIRLLQRAGLPVADLSANRLALAADHDGVLQGVIGLESFGKTALLRSLVVSEDARGGGIGPGLVTALEVACAADGVEEIWLLTIDADDLFSELGYAPRARDSAPVAIRNTQEFSGLCPGDAVLMSKILVAG
jgi:N-acetylglutamate synthase-like GNAT family acetyltransferase